MKTTNMICIYNINLKLINRIFDFNIIDLMYVLNLSGQLMCNQNSYLIKINKMRRKFPLLHKHSINLN